MDSKDLLNEKLIKVVGVNRFTNNPANVISAENELLERGYNLAELESLKETAIQQQNRTPKATTNRVSSAIALSILTLFLLVGFYTIIVAILTYSLAIYFFTKSDIKVYKKIFWIAFPIVMWYPIFYLINSIIEY